MASRPRSVDLGPIYLQVGEQTTPDWTAPGGEADAKDVARFESLMNRRRGQQQQSEVTPEMLLGALADYEREPYGEPDDIGAEIAHLWMGTGMHSAREVRVGLREALLPDTSVRLYESQGRLCIDFTCGTNRVALWLDRKLQVLARELGTRLDRPLALKVYMGDGSRAAGRDWPEDDQ
jgi:hypothetical protein